MSPRLSLVFSHPTERMLEMASKNGVSEVSHSEAGVTPALQQQQNPAYGPFKYHPLMLVPPLSPEAWASGP